MSQAKIDRAYQKMKAFDTDQLNKRYSRNLRKLQFTSSDVVEEVVRIEIQAILKLLIEQNEELMKGLG